DDVNGTIHYHEHMLSQRVVAIDSSAGMLAKVAVPAVRADAQQLPFRDASFDRVMANHVLYHVRDMTQALREIRRVAQAGARVVIATNSRSTMQPLFALTDAAAAETGVEGGQTVALRFGIEDTELVHDVFPEARLAGYEDAFSFRLLSPCSHTSRACGSTTSTRPDAWRSSRALNAGCGTSSSEKERCAYQNGRGVSWPMWPTDEPSLRWYAATALTSFGAAPSSGRRRPAQRVRLSTWSSALPTRGLDHARGVDLHWLAPLFACVWR